MLEAAVSMEQFKAEIAGEDCAADHYVAAPQIGEQKGSNAEPQIK